MKVGDKIRITKYLKPYRNLEDPDHLPMNIPYTITELRKDMIVINNTHIQFSYKFSIQYSEYELWNNEPPTAYSYLDNIQRNIQEDL